MATNEETSQSGKSGGKRGINGCLVLILVLLLGGVIVYLLSVINSQRYYLYAKDGQLVIEQGLFLPVGSKAFVPADGTLYEQYAPLNIPAGEILPEKSTYSNLGELNRRLFGLLSSWTKKSMAEKEAKAFDKAIYYVDRARRLSGLSDDQQKELKGLRGELAYIDGERLVKMAFDDLAKALKSFKLAGELGGSKHKEAEKWIIEIDKRLDAYRRLGQKHAPAAALEAFDLPAPIPALKEEPPVAAVETKPVSPAEEQEVESAPPVQAAPDAPQEPEANSSEEQPPKDEEQPKALEAGASAPAPNEELPRSPGSL